MLIVNPKREHESVEVKPFWYSYYAGYSHTFTQKIIESADLQHEAIILDPWNGAGTTTLMASINGYQSVGIDLNPAMRVIAKAKQTVKEDIAQIKDVMAKLNSTDNLIVNPSDSLFSWFDTPTIGFIRTIERNILEGIHYNSTFEKVNSLSSAQCLMYTALFNCVREYLAKFIPSNPTWIKKPKNEEDRCSVSWSELKGKYTENVTQMLSGISVIEHSWDHSLSNIIIGSSESLPLDNSSIDLIVTSPPYCTRIDYGVATLPELSILCIDGNGESDSIRRKLMGTTTVAKNTSDISNLVDTCQSFLNSVKNHQSKASETYYYKNLSQYFLSLDSSIKEIARVLKIKSKFICVVQDSYYKDIHCDLPSIICETAEQQGLKLKERIEFEAKRNMANLNMKAKKYRSKSAATETVLIFKKG